MIVSGGGGGMGGGVRNGRIITISPMQLFPDCGADACWVDAMLT